MKTHVHRFITSCQKGLLLTNVQWDIKKTWNPINNLLGKRTLSGIPNIIFNKDTKLNEFNSYFAYIGKDISQNIPPPFLQLHNILISDQYGFRKQHSTNLAVLNLFQHILENIEHGKYCVGIFMDLSKAFNTIDHHIILQELYFYGVRGNAFNLFENYWTNRTQYVVINGVNSSTQLNSCGVPQGSVLGTLMFLVYINDIIISSKII